MPRRRARRGAAALLQAAVLSLLTFHTASAPVLSDVFPAAGGYGTTLHLVGADLLVPGEPPPVCRCATPG